MQNHIDLLESSDDENLLYSKVNLTISKTPTQPKKSPSLANRPMTTLASGSNPSSVRPHVGTKRTAATFAPTSAAKKSKPAKPSKSFALIWVCHHGKGQSRTWRKKDLKIVGVYPSKAAVEQAKAKVMSQYECCGHGDILVGGTWADEIDLVIRKAPMFME